MFSHLVKHALTVQAMARSSTADRKTRAAETGGGPKEHNE